MQSTYIFRGNLQEIVFVMDNHATQKNYYVLAFLKWLAKTCRIPKTGKKQIILLKTWIAFFLCIFLVRGHTHNKLDVANKEPSMRYFKADKIETMTQFVCF